MEIISIQLTESARSVLNMSFVSSEHYKLTHEKIDGVLGVLVSHEKRGEYWVPMTSVAWCKVKKKKPKAKAKAPAPKVAA